MPSPSPGEGEGEALTISYARGVAAEKVRWRSEGANENKSQKAADKNAAIAEAEQEKRVK